MTHNLRLINYQASLRPYRTLKVVLSPDPPTLQVPRAPVPRPGKEEEHGGETQTLKNIVYIMERCTKVYKYSQSLPHNSDGKPKATTTSALIVVQ